MKRIAFSFALAAAFAAAGAEIAHPAFGMSEADLIAAAQGGELNDRVTACQELGHKGTPKAVPVLAALLTEETEAPLFFAARYGLHNIPCGCADKALEAAAAKLKGARREGVLASLRLRKNPRPAGYCPKAPCAPKNAVQKGDLAAIPGLVELACGTGPEAVNARRNLTGFPNAAAVGEYLKLAQGGDAKKAKLAIEVLGNRRERSVLPKLYAMYADEANAKLRGEIARALGNICDAKSDIKDLLGLVKRFPGEDRVAGAVIRVASRAFATPEAKIEIESAKYGSVADPKKSTDVKGMVEALVAAGSRTIMSGNRLAGNGGFPYDPAKGEKKCLRVKYRVDGGPYLTLTVPENSELEFVEQKMPECVSRQIIAAYAAAQGAEREALKRVLDSLEKRGEMPDPEGLLSRAIFNGKDLAGWSQKGDFFRAENGTIVGETTEAKVCKPNHHLIYVAEELEDFDLTLEFRLSQRSNSGVQLRCPADRFTGDSAYQADMDGGGSFVGFLYHPRQHLVGERGAEVRLAADGKKTVERFADGNELRKLYRAKDWNRMRAKVEGRTITVWINGVKTAFLQDEREAFFAKKGGISLQLHQGPPMKIEFRNVRIR